MGVGCIIGKECLPFTDAPLIGLSYVLMAADFIFVVQFKC